MWIKLSSGMCVNMTTACIMSIRHEAGGYYDAGGEKEGERWELMIDYTPTYLAAVKFSTQAAAEAERDRILELIGGKEVTSGGRPSFLGKEVDNQPGVEGRREFHGGRRKRRE